jgi:hypothetical protein
MAEPKSAALPLGYAPTGKLPSTRKIAGFQGRLASLQRRTGEHCAIAAKSAPEPMGAPALPCRPGPLVNRSLAQNARGPMATLGTRQACSTRPLTPYQGVCRTAGQALRRTSRLRSGGYEAPDDATRAVSTRKFSPSLHAETRYRWRAKVIPLAIGRSTRSTRSSIAIFVFKCS